MPGDRPPLVEQGIGRTGFQQPEYHNDQLGATRQQYRNEAALANAGRTQHMGVRIGRDVERPVGDRVTLIDEGDLLGLPSRDPLHYRMNRDRFGVGIGGIQGSRRRTHTVTNSSTVC